VKQPKAILAQMMSPDPKPLKLVLYFVRPRIAAFRLLRIRILAIGGIIIIAARLRLPVLARRACFAPRFLPRWIELRNASTRFCALTSHVETLGYEPT